MNINVRIVSLIISALLIVSFQSTLLAATITDIRACRHQDDEQKEHRSAKEKESPTLDSISLVKTRHQFLGGFLFIRRDKPFDGKQPCTHPDGQCRGHGDKRSRLDKETQKADLESPTPRNIRSHETQEG